MKRQKKRLMRNRNVIILSILVMVFTSIAFYNKTKNYNSKVFSLNEIIKRIQQIENRPEFENYDFKKDTNLLHEIAIKLTAEGLIENNSLFWKDFNKYSTIINNQMSSFDEKIHAKEFLIKLLYDITDTSYQLTNELLREAIFSISLFHIHSRGSPPSYADVNASIRKNVTQLVISHDLPIFNTYFISGKGIILKMPWWSYTDSKKMEYYLKFMNNYVKNMLETNHIKREFISISPYEICGIFALKSENDNTINNVLIKEINNELTKWVNIYYNKLEEPISTVRLLDLKMMKKHIEYIKECSHLIWSIERTMLKNDVPLSNNLLANVYQLEYLLIQYIIKNKSFFKEMEFLELSNLAYKQKVVISDNMLRSF